MLEAEKYMRMALDQAALDTDEVPVGAVVVYKGKVIAQAHNEREGGHPFAHAEMLAMERAAKVIGNRRLQGCTLYVTLEPCPMCAGAMVMAQLEKCVFGAYDTRQGCCGSVYMIPEDRHFFHRTVCIGGILEEECTQLLQRFFADKRQPNS